LTQANRRADPSRRRHQPNQSSATARPPKPERRCKRCGGQLPHRDRVYCDDCLPHYQQERYQAFLAAGRAHKKTLKAIGDDPSHSGPACRSGSREILPRLQEIPLYTLALATGLSHVYLSQIRRGRKTPHPRHWAKLAMAAGVRD
jgi:hypothetical protein